VNLQAENLPSSKVIGDWGEHWVALRLLEQGWQIKFLGDAVPSYDMIAFRRDFGARTIQVKTIGRNSGAIDLGPQATFSADVLIFVANPMTADAVAYLYPGDLVSRATTTDLSSGPFSVDRNPKKSTGKIHVWTRNNTKSTCYFPTIESREAWEVVASGR
jgi:hypothetical protein